MFAIKGFGVIAMTLGAYAVVSFPSGSRTSSTPSLVIGVVFLVVGAALFFLPGRERAKRQTAWQEFHRKDEEQSA